MNQNIILIVFIFAYLALYINRGLISTSLVYMTDELNLDWYQQGLISTSFICGYIIFCIITSMFINKINIFKILIFGIILWCIGNLIILFLKISYIFIYVYRFTTGCGDAIFQIALPSFVMKKFDDPNKKLSILYSVINIGIALGNLIGGLTSEWKSIIIYQIILMIPILIVIIKLYNNTIYNVSYTSNIKIIKKILILKDWWINLIGYILINYGTSTVMLWIPTVLKDKYSDIKYDIITVSFSIIFLFGSILLSLSGTKILLLKQEYNKINRLFFICSISCLLMTGFNTLAIMTNKFVLFCIAYGIFIYFYSLAMLSYSIIIVDIVNDDSKSMSMAISIVLSNLVGSSLSPIICSFIISLINSLSLSLVISSISIIIASVIFAYGAYIKRDDFVELG